MRQIEASAPGKAVLIGEYAVLHGAAALVLAVERRVRVRITSCLPEASCFQTPQLSADPIRFKLEADGGLSWPQTATLPPDLALSCQLLTHALARWGTPEPGGLQIRIDSAELFVEHGGKNTKLGLGSSAAVTVALSAALEHFLAASARARPPLAELLASHRREQGGRGSGLDLAAALEGGLLAYQLIEQQATLRRLEWPAEWPMLFVWTGCAASTSGFLEAYARWRGRQPEAAAALWQEMDECSREAVASVETRALDRFMTCINNYLGLMGKIGAETGAPVVSRQHQRLAGIARACGAAYKPCGAGGGDLGVFLAADQAQLSQLRKSIAVSGFRELPLKPALTGLQLGFTENDCGPS